MAKKSGNVRVEVSMPKVLKLVGESSAMRALVWAKTRSITARANSLGSGYRTGIRHDESHKRQGGTKPVYEGDVQTYRARKGGEIPVGIVHPANYAAMKDNHLHNTLLKARG